MSNQPPIKSTHVLLLTHGNIGNALIEAAQLTWGRLPLPVTSVAVSPQCNADTLIAKLRKTLSTLSQAHQILVLTDLFGSTPANVAQRLDFPGLYIVCGVSLPMLLKIMNYPQAPIDLLANKAVEGGKEGVVQCSSHVK